MTKQKLPKDLTHQKIKTIIGDYDKQTDTEAISEAEMAYKNAAMVSIPKWLLPKVYKLIAQRQRAP